MSLIGIDRNGVDGELFRADDLLAATEQQDEDAECHDGPDEEEHICHVSKLDPASAGREGP